MSMKRPWYKRFPDHFIAGTIHLTFEQRAAYSMLIDLAHGGERLIPNDDRVISRALGIRIHYWKRLKKELESAAKLRINSTSIGVSPSQPIEKIESGIDNKNKKERKKSAGARARGKACAPASLPLSLSGLLNRFPPAPRPVNAEKLSPEQLAKAEAEALEFIKGTKS
jgi:hypothetical protein